MRKMHQHRKWWWCFLILCQQLLAPYQATLRMALVSRLIKRSRRRFWRSRMMIRIKETSALLAPLQWLLNPWLLNHLSRACLRIVLFGLPWTLPESRMKECFIEFRICCWLTSHCFLHFWGWFLVAATLSTVVKGWNCNSWIVFFWFCDVNTVVTHPDEVQQPWSPSTDRI